MAPQVKIKELIVIALLVFVENCSAQGSGSGACEDCDGDDDICKCVDECADNGQACHANATCTNNIGTYSCSCNAGFTGNGTYCTIIDGGDCDDDCVDNASCQETEDGSACVCDKGFSGNGTLYCDINECTLPSHNCDTNAVCVNTEGSFNCICKDGYTGNGITCEDINECTVPSHNCDTNADCANIDGSFNCTCQDGYTGSGTSCTDYCDSDPCKNGGSCTATPDTSPYYSCTCTGTGYQGDTCEDDYCVPEPCKNGGSCTATDTSPYYTCDCTETGYLGDTCEDIDECAFTETNDCSRSPSGICINTEGSYSCECAEGFGGNGKDCQEIEVPGVSPFSFKETSVKIELSSKLRHQVYIISVTLPDDTEVKNLKFTNAQSTLIVTVDGLTADTNYFVKAKIVKLQNGFEYDGSYSDSVSFSTAPSRTPANLRLQQVFIFALYDLNSPASITLITSITTSLKRSSISIRIVIIHVFYPGSIGVGMELVTDPAANETLADVSVPNATLTEVPKGQDPAPANVIVSNITTSSYRIVWDTVENAMDYQVFVEYQSTSDTKTTKDTSLVVTGLPDNSVIVTSVRAILQRNDEVTFTNSSEDITLRTIAEGPENFTITVFNGNDIIIKFSAVATADIYYVTFADNSELDFTIDATEQVNGEFSQEISGLTADTMYSVSVIAQIEGTNSTASTASATTGPATVSGVSIYNVSTDGFNVEFDLVTIEPTIITTYVIKYTSETETKEVETSLADVMINADNPIDNDYSVSVAYKTTKTSGFSENVKTRIWNITSVAADAISLTFDAYKSASSYNASITPGSTQEVSTEIVTFDGLSAGTSYTVQVVTGEKLLFAIAILTCPAPVSNLICSAKNTTCVSVDFNSSESFFVVNVQDNQFAAINIDEADTSAEICNLTADVTYTVKIKSMNDQCGSTEETTTCVVDVNECENSSRNDCHENADCQNTIGLFTCSCKDGYSGDGKTNCDDINECTTPSHNCDTNAVCVNTEGSFNCNCKDGYTGNGTTCEDADECTLNTDNCSGNATCTNNVGSFSCACNSGFSGDGVNCSDVDECASSDTNDCSSSPAGVCNNTIGSYSCACAEGYGGTGKNCLEIEIPDANVISVKETSITLEIDSKLRHRAYKISLTLRDDSEVKNVNFTDAENTLSVVIDGLTAATDYIAKVKIVELLNGYKYDGAFSDPVSFTTNPSQTPANLRLEQAFTSELNDLNSPEAQNLTASIRSSMINASELIKNVTVHKYINGSVVALMEVTTDPTVDKTLNDVVVPGATLTEVPKGADPPPANVVVSDITTSSYTITWDAVKDATDYQVFVDYQGTSAMKTTSVNSLVVTDLPDNTVVVTSVRAIIQRKGVVSFTNRSDDRILRTLNPAVANFVVLTNTQDGGIVLQWDEISTATSYVINVTTSSGSKTSITANSSPQNVETTLGLTYNFTIQAENSAGVLGLTTELTNIAAAKPKEIVLEITLNSTFIFSDDLKNTSSDAYKQLKTYIEDLFSQIFGGVRGFVKVSFVGAFRGSVVIRVDVEIDNPSTAVGDLITAFSETSVDKSAFNETAENLTPNLNECLNEPSVCDEDAICTNTDDSYTCACKDGFEGDGTSCSDIDECTSTPCQENANCANTIGSYTCSCKNGFEVDGAACSDIDECDNDSTCSGNSTCSNNIGGFVCDCPAGYEYNNIACIDVDECDDNPCKSNSNCVNVIGNYTCLCVSGYSGDGKTLCADVDECVSDPCNPNSQCKNSEGTYSCPCNSGYTGDGKTSCVDVNECLNNPCTSNSQCENNDGSYTCPCVTGYTGDGRTSCSDIDECNITPSSCTVNQTCDNTIGSFSCPCKSGYAENSDKTDCLDVDECATTNSCHENASCANNIGSYSCSCKVGYTGNGTACDDVDECLDTSACGENEMCKNTIGSFNCPCLVGYNRDNTSACVDVNECEDTGICGDNSDCTNTDGSFNCKCIQGYTSDGASCVDDNECSKDTDNCTDRAECENTIGSFICNCKTGYTGSNNVCDDIDECSSAASLCISTGQCYNTIGSYRCDCSGGYEIVGVNNCVNIDECSRTPNCPSDRVCQDTVGSYGCICKTGYTGEFCLNGTTCENCADVNECNQVNDCNTNAICTNTDGSYFCACKEYYEGDGKTCTGNMTRLFISQTIEKYDYTPALSRATINKPDLTEEVQDQVELQFPNFIFISVTFSSGSGTSIIAKYVIETAAPVTIPVNISLYYNPNVGDTALFSNDPELDESCSSLNCSNGYCYSYRSTEACACNVGYDLSNNQCGDIDECASGQDTCHSNATCSNIVGSYNCNCKSGYTGSGFDCSDFDECVAGTFTCRDNSTCQNSIGSYNCPCQPGFIESTEGTCVGQCEDLSFCNNGGTCVPSLTADTPTCQCPSAYTGDRCQDSSLYRNLAIAFGVIGGVLLVALIAAVIIYIVRKKRGGRDFIP